MMHPHRFRTHGEPMSLFHNHRKTAHYWPIHLLTFYDLAGKYPYRGQIADLKRSVRAHTAPRCSLSALPSRGDRTIQNP
jgi:hypothetical protein